MDITNPYASPQIVPALRTRAQILLARRRGRADFYLPLLGKGYIAINLLLLAVIAFLWYAGMHPMVYLVGGYTAARLFRDIQWCRMIGRDWETSQEFIDWTKVEKIASAPE